MRRQAPVTSPTPSVRVKPSSGSVRPQHLRAFILPNQYQLSPGYISQSWNLLYDVWLLLYDARMIDRKYIQV